MAVEGTLLVIDNDRNTPAEMQRILRGPGVTVLTAQETEQGLKCLEENPVDIVIADFRMHQTDGFHLLKQIRADYPSVHRILMSGFLDQGNAMRFISSGLVTTFMAKNLEAAFLREKIGHILSVRSILQKEKLLDLISSIEGLPALPSLYRELVQSIEDGKSMEEIAEILKRDTAIAAKVLHVVNSAFFGREDISSITEAAIYLGVDVLKDIVLTAEIIGKGRWSDEQIGRLRTIFLHSFMVGRYLPFFHKLLRGKSRKGQLEGQSVAPFPSIGIVHDIGKIIILELYRERYQAIVEQQARTGNGSFYVAELALGFEQSSHAEIGAYFLDWWNLPQAMIETALFHHRADTAASEYRDLIKATYVTDTVINHIQDNLETGELDLNALSLKDLSGEELGKLGAKIARELETHNDFIETLV